MAEMHVKRKVTVSVQVLNDFASRPHSPTNIPTVTPAKLTSLQSSSNTSTPLRPRAKVNASATVASSRKSFGALSPGHIGGATTPRSPRKPSLSRPQDALHKQCSPISGPVNHAHAHYQTLPRPRNATNVTNAKSAFASVVPDSTSIVKPISPRVRHGSMSSLSQVSPASMARTSSATSPASSVLSSSLDLDPQPDVSSMRVKAKLSNIAKSKLVVSSTPPSPSASPSISPGLGTLDRLQQRLGRTASVSSISSKDLPSFATIDRTPPVSTRKLPCDRPLPGNLHSSQSPVSSVRIHQNAARLQAEVGSAVFPPLSPPSSAISCSSHSSGSCLSTSPVGPSPGIAFRLSSEVSKDDISATTYISAQGEPQPSLLLGAPNHHRPPEVNSVNIESDDERNLRAEAKSIRKIADLEITNKSLLAINVQLETQKHKQMSEMRELRRKLRESRLILPPRVYRQLKSSGGSMFDDGEETDEQEGEKEYKDEQDAEERMSNEIEKLSKEDEQFARVYGMLETLLTAGRLALATKIEDIVPSRVVAKVLNEEEARPWRDIQEGSECQIGTLKPDIDITLGEDIASADTEAD